MAWEYNCPPVVLPSRAAAAPQSFLSTSENFIMVAVRRLGNEIEVRLSECLGIAGQAELSLSLPHQRAVLSDMAGGKRQPISAQDGRYRFAVRPQQIVTLRLHRASAGETNPVMNWDEMVPPSKHAALHEYSNERGLPPRGGA